MTLAGARVLLVEDEALISMLVAECLEQLGCKVVGTAARLDEAVQKARALPMDLAVLDINLAGKLSYPVADILSSRGIPFVFATGYGADGLPDALRGVPVVSKPFRRTQLGDALKEAMSGLPG